MMNLAYAMAMTTSTAIMPNVFKMPTISGFAMFG